LLEWVTRELALIDVSIAVDGVEQELCRWLGNVNRAGLIRAFLTFDPDSLDDRRAAALDIDKYDIVIAPSRPAADLPWTELPPALAPQDDLESIRSYVPIRLLDASRDPEEVALMFEHMIVDHAPLIRLLDQRQPLFESTLTVSRLANHHVLVDVELLRQQVRAGGQTFPKLVCPVARTPAH
jgi:hypothetical protein